MRSLTAQPQAAGPEVLEPLPASDVGGQLELAPTCRAEVDEARGAVGAVGALRGPL
ncbi:MAG: hypothetical protein WKF94_16385 [Solirubrobacteraceae bacterium]|jgi:hypothetical protein